MTIKKKMDDMPYCDRYNVALLFIELRNFNVNLKFLKFNLKAMNLEYIIYTINYEIVIHIW